MEVIQSVVVVRGEQAKEYEKRAIQDVQLVSS